MSDPGQQNEMEDSADLEAMLKRANGQDSDDLLRRFACECCREIASIFNDPIYDKILEFAEDRTSRFVMDTDLMKLRSECVKFFDAMYARQGSPSATLLALCAVGDAAFTESALNAAINASDFAARAVASSMTETVEDSQYDIVRENAYRAERQSQFEVWRRLC